MSEEEFAGPGPDKPVPYAKIVEFFVDRGIKTECEVCGNEQWNVWSDADPNVSPFVSSYAQDRNGHVDVFHSRHGEVTRAFCTNCGNLRQFVTSVIRDWIAEKNNGN